MKKYIYLTVFLLMGIFAGNQIFNHLNAWLGMAVILAFIGIFFYKLIKYLTNENIE